MKTEDIANSPFTTASEFRNLGSRFSKLFMPVYHMLSHFLRAKYIRMEIQAATLDMESNLYFALGHAPLSDQDSSIAARGLEVESPLTGPTLHATPGDRGRGGVACKNSCVINDDVFLAQGRPLESA
ncbi:hypothetical protein PAXRUDRAFT_17158 [Paxillus rubicundulus Ve08.2h10]|uniref:Uncharacterized protein n=1 Tax=Paxillus rubicundulus Ve08.2h10 TaxID=930991 RepID=A0A0D0CRJ7_9AGAM|nr:hypothetical protein PAXRUDRAFT_17158 [Paxillus rubicundulus Ve08.2h10]